MGGADQVIISRFDFPENAWVESIKDFETGKIYTQLSIPCSAEAITK